MPLSPTLARHARAALRIALSHYVTLGLSAAFGIFLISGVMHLWLGPVASAAASIGVIVATPPDQVAPRRGKFWQLLPAALIGPPLFIAVQALHAQTWALSALLVGATFFAFLGAAWGKRGLPISMAVMFAVIFPLASPAHGHPDALWTTGWHFAVGALAYVVYATAANALLNGRYRTLMLADTLLQMAPLMRTLARQFTVEGEEAASADARKPLVGQLLQQQAALTDQIQSARNLLLESPRTPRRQQLASMLVTVLEMRDHLVACELDLDTLRAHPAQAELLNAQRSELDTLAHQVELLADALLLGRTPDRFDAPRPRPMSMAATSDLPGTDMPSPDMLARGLVDRVGHLHDEVQRLIALARDEQQPDLAAVRTNWQLFISPTAWSWRPLLGLWRWDAPPLRHAIRAALAVAAGLAVGEALPWGTHEYWILLTIVVVLRGSFAQTLERRNIRVAGTLLGCVLAGGLLATHPSPFAVLLAVTVAQGVAHAFAVRRYLVTAVAATLLALLQAHQLNTGTSLTFDATERVADTLIGVLLAWAFSYVLPSWERSQIPALVKRTLAAQARHAKVALGLAQFKSGDNETELGWRLARREVYDSLSALVLATQRSLSEPRAVRPPLEPLGRLLAHSYQLLAQLTSVKTMLLLRKDRLSLEQIGVPLQHTAEAIEASLSTAPTTTEEVPAETQAAGPVTLPDPFESDLNPWLLRRLGLARGLAGSLRADAQQALTP
jgi:uncharacterized membrane protein YccC